MIYTERDWRQILIHFKIHLPEKMHFLLKKPEVAEKEISVGFSYLPPILFYQFIRINST